MRVLLVGASAIALVACAQILGIEDGGSAAGGNVGGGGKAPGGGGAGGEGDNGGMGGMGGMGGVGGLNEGGACAAVPTEYRVAGCPSLHFMRDTVNCSAAGEVTSWDACAREWTPSPPVAVTPINNQVGGDPCGQGGGPVRSVAPVCGPDGVIFDDCNRTLLSGSVANLDDLVVDNNGSRGVTVFAVFERKPAPAVPRGILQLGDPAHNCDFIELGYDFTNANARFGREACRPMITVVANSVAPPDIRHLAVAKYGWDMTTANVSIEVTNPHAAMSPGFQLGSLQQPDDNLVIGGRNPGNGGNGMSGEIREIHIYGCDIIGEDLADIRADISGRQNIPPPSR